MDTCNFAAVLEGGILPGKSPDVVLMTMPFVLADRPSLGLSLLAQCLRQDG
jgi:hypothetical protein